MAIVPASDLLKLGLFDFSCLTFCSSYIEPEDARLSNKENLILEACDDGLAWGFDRALFCFDQILECLLVSARMCLNQYIQALVLHGVLDDNA